MLWLQVFNTFCDVAQFLLQSPQLPFYDYFGRALPPCRAKALMQKQFPEVFTSPRTCRKTERERRREGEGEQGALPRHSTAFENQYDCDYAALAVSVSVSYLCVCVCLCLCVCVCPCVYVRMMWRVLRAYSNLQIARCK